MSLLARRGTSAALAAKATAGTLVEAEILYTLDTDRLHVAMGASTYATLATLLELEQLDRELDGLSQVLGGKVDDTELAAALSDFVAKTGGTIVGRLNLEPATLPNNNGAANFANRNVYKASMSASMTLAVSNIPDGSDGEVRLAYNGGTLSFSGVTRWAVDSNTTSTNFSATQVGAAGLVSGSLYMIVFSNIGGIITGRIGKN